MTVDVVKVTQQWAELIQCGCQFGCTGWRGWVGWDLSNLVRFGSVCRFHSCRTRHILFTGRTWYEMIKPDGSLQCCHIQLTCHVVVFQYVKFCVNGKLRQQM